MKFDKANFARDAKAIAASDGISIPASEAALEVLAVKQRELFAKEPHLTFAEQMRRLAILEPDCMQIFARPWVEGFAPDEAEAA